MMIIQYSKHSSNLVEIIEILEAHSFAFKKEESSVVDEVKLIEGSKSYIGYEAVKNHVRKLASDASQWWYCQCDG